ncbi:hypothetical protein AT269_09420 [Bacillus cereus]|nr:hypothetical protein AT269_09420 [Bacillus cereus]
MKKLLVLNHFPITNPPLSGGTLRYFHIYNELSNYFNVTLLSQSCKRHTGFFQYSTTFREYKIAGPNLKHALIKKMGIKNFYELLLVLNIELSNYPSEFQDYFEKLYNENDIIIFESPYLLGYDRYFGFDNKPRIYNSHNHEFELAKQIWRDTEAIKYLPHVYKFEKKLVTQANLVFTPSEQDRRNMINAYNASPSNIKIAFNGVSPEQWQTNKKNFTTTPNALFIGSEYMPNIEAVDFIMNQLADQCPSINFTIVGNCCKPFSTIKKNNVLLLGKVTHQQKISIFSSTDFAINPILYGAGVNLKTLEYLSAGLPLFSTYYGVRGINLKKNEHYIHANRKDFSKKINHYTKDLSSLRKNAFVAQEYINSNYSWKKISLEIVNEIEKIKI